ncbi:Crp/Fnr family transcriptional regulator [Mesorhizobium sp. BR1-1-16]|uniref:Crp/Fnr family transcriptional regulator n=1 Tax=Mesorhizobium sp. BR1-1-16 TaxID=2876653 RepID=UPI001CC94E3C|nr:Crp/Fnr family transcriptional regulator [Mesorhizobium sp. BR1-1-16]
MTLQDPPDVDSEHFLNIAGSGRSLSNYPKKFTLFTQGSIAESVFYIRRGKIKLTVASSGGKEVVIALLGRDEFFGQGCLAGQTRRMATATALTDCAITRFDQDSISALLQTDPAFSRFFLERMLKRSIRADEDLVDQLFNSSEKRLARALLLLANYGSDTPVEPVLPKISQETLAEMIGTTRSRVSFFMNKFRRLGYISYKAQLEIHASLLNVLVDEPDDTGRPSEHESGAFPAASIMQPQGAEPRFRG